MGLCVAAAAVSCSNELVDSDFNHVGSEETDMISFVVADDLTRGGSFGNRPGTSTRGAVSKPEDINTFAVYGTFNNSSNNRVLFNGTEVSQGNDGKWTYGKKQYWSEGEYSFLAIYPHTDPATTPLSNVDYSSDSNSLSFQYTLPTDYKNATDILIAGHKRKYADASDADVVKLYFSHIMSRINFVAKIDPAIRNTEIKIKNITLKGVASKASCTVGLAEILPGSKQTSDLAGLTWTVSQTPQRIQFSKDTDATLNSANKIYSAELFPVDDQLLVIPQTVTSDILVEMTYSRNGKETTIQGRMRSASYAHGYSWSAGRSYTYSFTLGVDDYIIFDTPAVDVWDEDEGGNYIVVG